jgi:hypothetical protein
MTENAAPLDHLIESCNKAVATGYWTLTKFTILNAADELTKLRQTKRDLAKEVYEANKLATEQTDLYLGAMRELEQLKKSLDKPAAFAKTNDKGDLYDLRLTNNPYDNQNYVVPLYRINNEQ